MSDKENENLVLYNHESTTVEAAIAKLKIIDDAMAKIDTAINDLTLLPGAEAMVVPYR